MSAPQDDYYELRMYRCTPGRLHDLHHRMGYELPPLFARHGVVRPLAYWEGYAGMYSPLYCYMLRWTDLDERFRAFGAFYQDPDWALQRDASNVGEHMVERVDLAICRPAPIWPEFQDPSPPRAVGGLHELRMLRLNTRNVPAAYRALADVDLPALKAAGAEVLAILSMWYGSGTPTAVILLAWPDFSTRERALRAHERDTRVQDARRKERHEFGGPLFASADSHLMVPARYGTARTNLAAQPGEVASHAG